MPRNKESNIRKYFLYDKEKDKSKCQCPIEKDENAEDDCGSGSTPVLCEVLLSGSKASNLRAHVAKIHPTVYEQFCRREAAEASSKPKRLKVSSCLTDKSPNETTQSRKMGTITSHFPSKPAVTSTKAVYMRKEDILDLIIQMVTVNSRPLTMIKDEWFRKLVAPIERTFDINLNYRFLIDAIDTKYIELRNKLTEVIGNKLVSVKTDCVSKLDRSFIGINLQFVHEGEIIIVTLGTVELLDRHTAQYLRNVILNELEKYNIRSQQIYTITTDNGANLCKAVKLIEEKSNENEDLLTSEEDEEFQDTDEELIDGICDAEYLVTEIEKCNWEENYIRNVRCAAHIVQLCITDTLKNTSKNNVINGHLEAIEEARKVVKELRKPTMANLRKKYKLKKPILDCLTRWNSTYEMLRTLFQHFHSFCDEYAVVNTALYLPQDTWTLIEEILLCFEPCSKALTKLQKAELTLTDVYTIYNVCYLDLGELGSPFSQELLNNFNKRRQAVFDHEVFLAALFLDPRYNFDMCVADKEKAIKHLIWLHNKIQNLKITADHLENKESCPGSDTESHSSIDSSEQKLEQILRMKRMHTNDRTAARPELELICRTLQLPAVKINQNVLHFWEKRKTDYPELWELAQIVFGTPGTQVSVERTSGSGTKS